MKRSSCARLALAFAGFAALGGPVRAQEAERERVLAAAIETMTSVRYCSLVTLDANGVPQARAMDPFPPEPDLTV
jgi:hypothetical protein